MSTEPTSPSAEVAEDAAGEAAGRAAWFGLGGGILLMAAAMAVPAASGWDVHIKDFPPIHAFWDPRLGPGTVLAVLVAGLASSWAVAWADTLSWRQLLPASYAAGLAWMISLALVDGVDGISDVLNHSYEYLETARATDDLPATLDEYVSRIPFDAEQGNWPVHIAGHPAGALVFFVALVRLGLGSGLAAGLVVTFMAASTAPAVLVTLRTLGAEAAARRAAPFLTFGPAAIWQCVSADGMFAAVAAWGLAALAVAGVRRSLAWSVVAGLLLGYCVMLSYGLPLLGVLAVAILVLAGSWRPLAPACLAAVAVVVGFAVAGFAWWEAFPVLRERYWDGVAHNRPAAYWLWGNFAALLFSAGPVLAAALAVGATRWRDQGSRVVVALAGAAFATVLLADFSQMSRGEVERIWLPFAPWLLVATALLPETWRRRGLILQLVAALAIQHLLHPDW